MRSFPSLRLNSQRPRRGSMILVVAVAILVVGGCLALVFDRLWVDAARVELQAAAESAALAGAAELATDHLLQQPDSDRSDLVRAAAVQAAGINFVTGTRVQLQDGEEGDVQIGVVEEDDNGDVSFVARPEQPTTCVVRTARLKSRGNPVAQFFQELTGKWHADVLAFAEASVDNRVIGVAPSEHGPVPALPLAILHQHPDPRQQNTWHTQINMQVGADRYSFDPLTGEVYAGPDGIPEIQLVTAAIGDSEEDAEKANVLTIDIGNGLDERRVVDQIKSGWTVDHLKSFGNELRIDQGPQQLDIDAALIGPLPDSFEPLLGQVRIVGLYTGHKATSGTLGQATLTDLVAIRVLAVEDTGSLKLRLTVQPAVITTRTAIVDNQDSRWISPSFENAASRAPVTRANPYIHKLFLSH